MKKALSILLSVMMVAGLFVALIPTASAADYTALDAANAPAMPDTGLLVYSEDFEGEDLAGLENVVYTGVDPEDEGKTIVTGYTTELTKKLGWVTADNLDTPADSYDEGIVGYGTASIVPDDAEDESSNKRIQMSMKKGEPTGSNFGWSTKIVDNDRLAGGDYVVEYTLTLDGCTLTGGNGFTIRNNAPWNRVEGLVDMDGNGAFEADACYAIHLKRNTRMDMHFRAANSNTTVKTYYWNNLGMSHKASGAASGDGLAGIPGLNYNELEVVSGATSDGSDRVESLIGATNTFRTVVSKTDGVQTYVYDLDNDTWVWCFGMDEAAKAAFAANAATIGSGINFVVRNGVTLSLDDINVYTIKDEAEPKVSMEGWQTAPNADATLIDTRFVAKVENLAALDEVKQVMYEIMVEETLAEVWLEYAYTSISADYGDTTYTAEADELFTALHVTGCPKGTTFLITPIVTLSDGAVATGAEVEWTVE